MRLMRQVVPVAAEHGGPRKKGEQADNVNLPSGNSETYLLRRLKRDRPDLADKVVAGKMNAHAAAVEAGFRLRLVQYPATVQGFLRALKKHLSESERKELITSSLPIIRAGRHCSHSG
jgi:hypothetical protein